MKIKPLVFSPLKLFFWNTPNNIQAKIVRFSSPFNEGVPVVEQSISQAIKSLNGQRSSVMTIANYKELARSIKEEAAKKNITSVTLHYDAHSKTDSSRAIVNELKTLGLFIHKN
uniref:Uncharacterized protein n=1 Tax=Polytomella parva TaxID=51329 RepID=A0A7S0YEP6_9CHLO|mmetsp:Transcript_22496/g.39903  ORF Transcript_22496/g.39903 Transcript_22496/m.39903 type:complete len:114 (+) Transcript_22496:75-416(+)